jgi:hypothetical protein
MKPRRKRNSVIRGRIVRCVAIFFLFYTGFDIASPQFCNDELTGLSAKSIATVAVAPFTETTRHIVTVSASDISRRDLPFNQESDDDDCFCCCTHVLPGMTFFNTSALDIKSLAVSLEQIFLPTPPLSSTFHPPRYA